MINNTKILYEIKVYSTYIRLSKRSNKIFNYIININTFGMGIIPHGIIAINIT